MDRSCNIDVPQLVEDGKSCSFVRGLTDQYFKIVKATILSISTAESMRGVPGFPVAFEYYSGAESSSYAAVHIRTWHYYRTST